MAQMLHSQVNTSAACTDICWMRMLAHPQVSTGVMAGVETLQTSLDRWCLPVWLDGVESLQV